MGKEKIRPLFSELQGYLSQAPIAEQPGDTLSDKTLWTHYNDTVILLSETTNKDYSRFLVLSERGGIEDFIYISTYRQKLGGLILLLHGEYFSDEPAPFSGMPSTVISQTQEQKQSTQIQMYLDIQSKIDHALQNVENGSKEKEFLEKFKNALSTVGNVNELFKLCFQLAKEWGIGITTLFYNATVNHTGVF